MYNKESNVMLLVGGFAHHVKQLLQYGAAGPLIEIPINEINDPLDEQFKAEHTVEFKPHTTEFDAAPVLFFKQHGKYTVLTGKDVVAQHILEKKTAITGRLLSTPAMKKARPVVVAVPTPTPVPAASHPAEFANRPRFDDERTGRYSKMNYGAMRSNSNRRSG